ncbi:MAG: thioredoxin domain-containing protein, partial [Nitrospirota bacterium]
MNRLSGEKSAYLKHAASQKVDWHPWSENTFEKARLLDRPVFLSSGAVWCHWCHVMAKECFYDDEIAGLLNNHFINIKLDRDERPDIDRRYQMAVAAMGQGGGWPLSVFLTPEKVPFFGGTYFPPEDMHRRPGLKKILKAVIELYNSKKDEIA